MFVILPTLFKSSSTSVVTLSMLRTENSFTACGREWSDIAWVVLSNSRDQSSRDNSSWYNPFEAYLHQGNVFCLEWIDQKLPKTSLSLHVHTRDSLHDCLYFIQRSLVALSGLVAELVKRLHRWRNKELVSRRRLWEMSLDVATISLTRWRRTR